MQVWREASTTRRSPRYRESAELVGGGGANQDLEMLDGTQAAELERWRRALA